MTDKIKERLYKISHYKYFYLIFFIIVFILMGLNYVIYTSIDVPIDLTLIISLIFVLLFFNIKSFKKYNLKIIKKNKLITIILSDEDCVSVPLCGIFGFIISVITYNFNLHFALLTFLILLGIVIIACLSTTIKNYYKKRIIK